MKMPAAYWAWERWKQHGGHRPHGLPERIPKAWWARHAIRVAAARVKPKPDLGVFGDSGVQFSNPGTGPLGPVEHMAGLARTGYAYASFEVFDGAGRKDWSIWHREAERNFIRQLPWARVRTPDDVIRLCRIATDWQQPPIVNLEDEANTVLPPSVVAELVAQHWRGQYAIQMLAILYDSVDWSPLNNAGAVCILEAYANEIPRFSDFDYLLKRASADFDRVILSPGMYEYPPGVLPERDLYEDAPGPWCLYLGDNVHDWADWRAP